jgi:hypothetical protein
MQRMILLRQESFRIVDQLCPAEIKARTGIVRKYPEMVQNSLPPRQQIRMGYLGPRFSGVLEKFSGLKVNSQ